MTNEEMQAISALLDSKLNEQLKPIHTKLDAMSKEIHNTNQKVDILYSWVDGLDLDVKQLKEVSK